MNIRITEQAAKELRKIGPDAARIVSKIEHYAADPGSLANNVKALRGRSGYRLRVGNFRVLFTVANDTMTVTAIRPRGRAYD